MMMINQQPPNSPCYIDTQPIPISPQMSNFDAPLRAVTPCSQVAAPMKMRKPEEAPAEPSSPTKKRRCRRVGFGPNTTLAYIESSNEFTQLEKDDRWYRSSEISSFKENARKLCKSSKHSSVSNEDNRNDVEKDSTRGLDVYYPARQRYSKRFIQHVLEAYYVRCVGNDEHVALLAEKWSKKSLTRATNTARKDFLVAYFPDEDGYESPPEDTASLASTLLHNTKGPKIVSTSA